MAGVAAYKTEIRKGGTPTLMSDEPTTALSSVLYQITDSTKRVLNRASSAEAVVNSGLSSVASSLTSINYLFGKVTVDATLAGSTAITVSGEYIPVGSSEKVTHANSHTLTLETTVLEDTGYAEAQASSGNRSRLLGLEDSNVSLSRFEDGGREFFNDMSSREDVLVEIKPGGGTLTFRGWYVVENDNFSGGVDELEAKDISLQANLERTSGDDAVAFGWSS